MSREILPSYMVPHPITITTILLVIEIIQTNIRGHCPVFDDSNVKISP